MGRGLASGQEHSLVAKAVDYLDRKIENEAEIVDGGESPELVTHMYDARGERWVDARQALNYFRRSAVYVHDPSVEGVLEVRPPDTEGLRTRRVAARETQCVLT
jgi:hypothetical protein